MTSPNYPENYEIHEECVWRINTPDGDAIFFRILDFDTENLYDVFKIGYGTAPSMASTVVYVYSGSKSVPDDDVIFDSDIWMRFISDSGNNHRGFQIELTAGKLCYFKRSSMCRYV